MIFGQRISIATMAIEFQGQQCALQFDKHTQHVYQLGGDKDER